MTAASPIPTTAKACPSIPPRASVSPHCFATVWAANPATRVIAVISAANAIACPGTAVATSEGSTA